ncbi:MAG: MOSC domain-containing protein [Anaerolineae bacterium]|nr:MOSC domain-containing protein [Anaerolineae bacterium]
MSQGAVVTGLYVYPVKSCAGIALDGAHLDARGFRFDRQWMIVDDDERVFLSQRELPAMALIHTAFDGESLIMSAPKMGDLALPLLQQPDAATLPVVVWRDTCIAVDEGEDAARWASSYLGIQARLVRMADGFVRPVDPKYARTPAQTGFSDAYPLLLASEASLDDLNARLSARGKMRLPMNRFRPNIVIGGSGAYAEDDWRQIHIGDTAFDVVKACARCVTTTVDQETGTVPQHDEPLATLATYRRGERGVLFGQNIIHRTNGYMQIGDSVSVGA